MVQGILDTAEHSLVVVGRYDQIEAQIKIELGETLPEVVV